MGSAHCNGMGKRVGMERARAPLGWDGPTRMKGQEPHWGGMGPPEGSREEDQWGGMHPPEWNGQEAQVGGMRPPE